MPAADDLERICDQIAQDNPEAARRVAGIIYDGCARLKDFPHLGHASARMAGRRELLFSTSAYDPKCRSRIAENTPEPRGAYVAPAASTFSSAPGMCDAPESPPTNRARANDRSASRDSSGWGR